MRNAIAGSIFLFVLFAGLLPAQPAADVAREILDLERQVMDGWVKGDPGPALAVADAEVTFIHDTLGERIEGLAALKTLYEQFRGTPLFESYEIRNPVVQSSGDSAVLTYVLGQRVRGSTRLWNGTVVYRKSKEGWRMIHSHWSAVKVR